MPSFPASSRYQPQLDGLRALAILTIVLDHNKTPYLETFHIGVLGVRLFFVMSGFLITRTLMSLRTKTETNLITSRRAFLDFYARRFIRTLPPYYLTIAISLLISFSSVRETLVWTSSFMTNFWISHHNEWPGVVSHLWSLAVQEQFYLVWPFILLLAPRRFLFLTIIGFALIAPLFRLWCIWNEASLLTRWMLPFGCLDALAIGSLAGYINKTWEPERLQRCIKSKFATGLAWAILVIAYFLRDLSYSNPFSVIVETLESISLAVFLSRAIEGFSGYLGKFLANRVLVSMGKMSYGIYLYHITIIVLTKSFFQQWLGQSLMASYAQAAFLCVITWGIAAISWFGLEEPMSHLRKYFVISNHPTKI